MAKFMVLVGNLSKGFETVGPFGSREDAAKWSNGVESWVMQIAGPAGHPGDWYLMRGGLDEGFRAIGPYKSRDAIERFGPPDGLIFKLTSPADFDAAQDAETAAQTERDFR